MARWEHDWRWLQATNPRPQVAFPHFFTRGDQDRTGQFMVGQTELYVSAYLRTLAFALIHGHLSEEVSEESALLALTMNRGLADLEPIDRPEWARDLLPWAHARTRARVHELWHKASTISAAEEVPVALDVVDLDKGGFVEIDVKLVVGARGLSTGPVPAETEGMLFVGQGSTDMAGRLTEWPDTTASSGERPRFVVQRVVPYNWGRVHSDMLLSVRLASPSLFGTAVDVECGSSDIRLVARDAVLARWMHWYADWEPTRWKEMDSFVGSVSTVSKAALDDFRTRRNMDIAKLVTVRWGKRPESWGEIEVEEETFWI